MSLLKILFNCPREDYAEQFVSKYIPYLKFNRVVDLGGEALILQCRDARLDVTRIVKIARPELKEIAKQRFIRSNKTLCSLQSPYFPTVLYLQENPLFVILDWASGNTLEEYIKSNSYSISRNIKIFQDLCKAVQILHERNIIHRDIKPLNIVVNGQTKLIDFGLAKKKNDSGLTQTEYALGTTNYAAPEQIEDAANVDQRADVFSLGKIFYFLTTKKETWAPELLEDSRLMEFFCEAISFNRDDRIPTVKKLIEKFSEIYHLQEKSDYSKIDAFEDLFIHFAGNTSRIKYYTKLTNKEIIKLYSALRERHT